MRQGKKVACLVGWAMAAFLWASSPVFALNLEIPLGQVRSFDATLDLGADASMLVQEAIQYDFGTEERHGIYRTIPLVSAEGPRIKISDISVTMDDQPVPVEIFRDSEKVEIKVGDPDQLVAGPHLYAIGYQVLGAVRYFEDYDEIYWNVTGNEWPVPIERAETLLNLPLNDLSFSQLRLSCYSGLAGQQRRCSKSGQDHSQLVEIGVPGVRFSQTEPLNAYEGLTVAVGFPKGVVAAPPEQIPSWMFPGGAVLMVVLANVIAYLKRRRPRQSIVPHYEPPADLSPSEASFLVTQLPRETLAADLIHLAVSGFIRIKKISETNYMLERLPQSAEPASPVELNILVRVFDGRQEIDLASVTEGPFDFIEDAVGALEDRQLLQRRKKGGPPLAYFAISWSRRIFGLFVLQAAVTFVMVFVFGFLGYDMLVQPYASIVWSVLILLVLWPRRPPVSLTPAGEQLRDELLGLKLYIGTAEAERIKFHNAPEKNPEQFDRLLPFAMIFGLEKQWTQKFGSIYQRPPDWYHDNSFAHGFSAAVLANSLAGFRTNVVDSSGFGGGSSHSSSGSGGGGHSGGGSGGGGGGSW